jgi:hypothetical protein
MTASLPVFGPLPAEQQAYWDSWSVYEDLIARDWRGEEEGEPSVLSTFDNLLFYISPEAQDRLATYPTKYGAISLREIVWIVQAIEANCTSDQAAAIRQAVWENRCRGIVGLTAE